MSGPPKVMVSYPVCLSKTGMNKWSRTYSLGTDPLEFIKVLQLDELDEFTRFQIKQFEKAIKDAQKDPSKQELIEGYKKTLQKLTGGDKLDDFIVLGHTSKKGRKFEYVLSRLAPDGTEKWTRRFKVENTSMRAIDLIRKDDDLIVAGWYNYNGKSSIELIRVDIHGAVGTCQRLKLSGHTQIYKLDQIFNVGIILGHSNQRGLMINLDQQEKQPFGYYIESNGNPKVKDYLFSQNQTKPSAYVFGTLSFGTSKKSKTFILKIANGKEIKASKGIVFQATKGDDEIKSVFSMGKAIYVLS